MELYADFFPPHIMILRVCQDNRELRSFRFTFVLVGLTLKLCNSAKAYSLSTNLPHGADGNDGY